MADGKKAYPLPLKVILAAKVSCPTVLREHLGRRGKALLLGTTAWVFGGARAGPAELCE